MKVKCYVRYKKGELICFCKKDNPGCDRCDKGQCNQEVAIIDKYKGIKETFKNNEKKR